MKIIKVDSYGREHIADHLVVEQVNEYWGTYIVEMMNDRQHDDSSDWFKLVKDDYVLWNGMEELV